MTVKIRLLFNQTLPLEDFKIQAMVKVEAKNQEIFSRKMAGILAKMEELGYEYVGWTHA